MGWDVVLRERAMLPPRTGRAYFSRLSSTSTCGTLVRREKTEISVHRAVAPVAPSRRPLRRGQSQPLASLADPTPASRLPAAGIINTSRLSAARGQAALPLPDGTSRGGKIGRLLEEENLAGWRAARPPWPPATAPASRRASLPDTSLVPPIPPLPPPPSRDRPLGCLRR